MMRTTIKQLKKLVREGLKKIEKIKEKVELEDEGVSQSKRAQHGYALEEPVDYSTGGEGRNIKTEDVDRLRRAKDGYGESQFEEGAKEDGGYVGDWVDGEEKDESMSLEAAISETSTPSDKAEEFITQNKKEFQKRYGPKWKQILYATASKKFGSEK